MNTYWNGNGTHKDVQKKLEAVAPSWGMTDNRYVNLYLAASNVYYDVYNNGGCNLRDAYIPTIEEHIKPFAGELKSLRFDVKDETLIRNLKKEEKLEAFIDEVLLFLADKDLSYTKYTLYFDNNQNLLSETEQDGFSVITFGIEEEYLSWKNHRVTNWGFQVI